MMQLDDPLYYMMHPIHSSIENYCTLKLKNLHKHNFNVQESYNPNVCLLPIRKSESAEKD